MKSRDWEIRQGDALGELRKMKACTVQTVVTSPPYWGLRDYGVNGQLGLEATPEKYVLNLVGVFREVRRVMRTDATLWLNMGDSYVDGGRGTEAGSTLNGCRNNQKESRKTKVRQSFRRDRRQRECEGLRSVKDLPAKNLLGMPWRLAFALQADGWYLRSDIIWSKPNSMPESATDRPAKSHEYVFLLTRSRKYYYDAAAVRQLVTGNTHPRGNGVNPKARKHPDGWAKGAGVSHRTVDHNIRKPKRVKQNQSFSAAVCGAVDERNLRSVWSIPTQPFPEAHFATYPTALVEPCILAGTSERGACPKCGTPWGRNVDKTVHETGSGRGHIAGGDTSIGQGWEGTPRASISVLTVGWSTRCKCPKGKPVPCLVLDPFAGSGTTGVVARRLGRRFIGIELSKEYAAMARKRVAELFSDRNRQRTDADLPLFWKS